MRSTNDLLLLPLQLQFSSVRLGLAAVWQEILKLNTYSAAAMLHERKREKE